MTDLTDWIFLTSCLQPVAQNLKEAPHAQHEHICVNVHGAHARMNACNMGDRWPDRPTEIQTDGKQAHVSSHPSALQWMLRSSGEEKPRLEAAAEDFRLKSAACGCWRMLKPRGSAQDVMHVPETRRHMCPKTSIHLHRSAEISNYVHISMCIHV